MVSLEFVCVRERERGVCLFNKDARGEEALSITEEVRRMRNRRVVIGGGGSVREMQGF